MLRLRRLLASMVCLLATCSPLPASERAAISPEPSPELLMMPRSECEEILDEFVATCNALLSEQERAFEARLQETAELAAAEAARPLLVKLAGTEASVRLWQRRALSAGIISAVVAGLCGVLLGLSLRR